MNFLSLLLKNKFALCSFIFIFFLLILVVLSFLGVSFGIYSFDSQNENMILEPPSPEHLLGTDQLGRDLLARLIYGARLSFSVAIVTALIAFFIGLSLGTFAATFKGSIDFVISRFTDIVYSLPDLLVLSIIGLLFNRSTTGILFAIGLIFIDGVFTINICVCGAMEPVHMKFVGGSLFMA